MKNKYLITGVNIGVDRNMHEYVSSFQVKGAGDSAINVDAVISGEFPELYDMTQDEQVDWAREQVGKHLFVEQLVPSGSYSAIGKTYIV